MVFLSFFDWFVQLKKSLSFQIHLLKLRHSIRKAAVRLQVIPSYFAEYSEKCLLNSAKTYKKYIVCNEFCVAFHNDKTCSVPNCKIHNILLVNVEELLNKLDTFCFTYHHVDCPYAIFKYRLSGKVIAKSG